MPPSPPRHASGWLDASEAFRALTDRANRLLALQADLRACAQARGLVALSLEEETLVVGTPGAAAAAKARQLEPTLIAHLSRRGWVVRRIRFRPMPVGSFAPPPPLQPKVPIPPQAVEAFRELAEASGSTRLEEALRQLVRRRSRGHG